jgi:hypothetical protein
MAVMAPASVSLVWVMTRLRFMPGRVGGDRDHHPEVPGVGVGLGEQLVDQQLAAGHLKPDHPGVAQDVRQLNALFPGQSLPGCTWLLSLSGLRRKLTQHSASRTVRDFLQGG